MKSTPLGAPIMCNNSYGLMQATLTGTGVTALNNKALLVNEPLNNIIISLLRTGDNIGFGTLLHTIQDVTQAQSADALLVSISKRLNVGGINASNDSGILAMDHVGSVTARFEEGDNAPGGGKYGQFFGRAASAMNTSFAFGAYRIPNPGDVPVPAIFWVSSPADRR